MATAGEEIKKIQKNVSMPYVVHHNESSGEEHRESFGTTPQEAQPTDRR